ncbi:MAG: Mu transposase C-terminal domain-containing protein, partial [Candidatus Sulfotelmatobacter sp.]
PTTQRGTANVSPGRGVIINRVYYWAEAFRDPTVENHDVSVRYDPFDIGSAYAFVKNRWTECHSEHYSVLQGRSEKEIMLASKELRRRRLLHSRERFTLTARKLADFLDSAEAEEKCLLQRLRDRESASLRQTCLVPVPSAHGAEVESTESESSSTTREISALNQAEATAVYGDF